MEILSFLYNIFLIILYSVVLSYSASLYIRKRKPVFLILTILFLFYIFDNTIIYMTEFIDSFSYHYDLQFMSIPAFKTVIIIATCVCMTFLQHIFIMQRDVRPDIAALVFLALMLMFVPMMNDGAFEVWLYYLPYQAYIFYLGLSGVIFIKKRPELYNQNDFLIHYRNIALLTAVSTIFILIEDTIVIFSIDIYSDIMVKINNRSFSEDIMGIVLSFFAIKHLSRAMYLSDTEPLKPEGLNGVDDCMKVVPVMSVYRNELDPVFYHFSSEFHLTGREQDILKVLLKDKNNQEISDELFISVGTVKTHVHNIFQKADVTKRSQLLHMYGDYQDNYIKKWGKGIYPKKRIPNMACSLPDLQVKNSPACSERSISRSRLLSIQRLLSAYLNSVVGIVSISSNAWFSPPIAQMNV